MLLWRQLVLLHVNADAFDAAKRAVAVPAESLGAILALEVLEHVDDIESLVAEFCRALGRRGYLLCGLPTENILYRTGRRLAGFSGAYHLRNPRDVLRTLDAHLKCRRVGRLYPLLPLFDFYEGRRAALELREA